MSEGRSNRLLLIGIAVFVVGAGLAILALKSDGGEARAGAKPNAAPAGAPAPQPTSLPKALARTQIPKGRQAVAVQLPVVPGLAGYARPGDRINLYAAIRAGQPNTRLRPPLVKLVLGAVRVLDVRIPKQGTGDTATYLLALDAKQAERLIFFAKYESLWMTLLRPGESPGKTSGSAYQNSL